VILDRIDSIDDGKPNIVDRRRDPKLRYAELADLGWTARHSDGNPRDFLLRLERASECPGPTAATGAVPAAATRRRALRRSTTIALRRRCPSRRGRHRPTCRLLDPRQLTHGRLQGILVS
jgi:hypothetical protein